MKCWDETFKVSSGAQQGPPFGGGPNSHAACLLLGGCVREENDQNVVFPDVADVFLTCVCVRMF